MRKIYGAVYGKLPYCFEGVECTLWTLYGHPSGQRAGYWPTALPARWLVGWKGLDDLV